MSTAVQPYPGSPADGLDPAILDAQRAANVELPKMPHPDPRTPQGLLELRALIAPPQRSPELTPTDVVIDGPGGELRLHIFTPDAPALGVMVRIHGGGWVGGAPEDDEALNDHICRTCQVAIVRPRVPPGPRERRDDPRRDRGLPSGRSMGSRILGAVRNRADDDCRDIRRRPSRRAHPPAPARYNDPTFNSIIGAHFDSGP
jgi:hypothetical protein